MTAWVTEARYLRKCFLALLGMIVGLVFIQHAVGVEIPTVVYLVVVAAIACVCNKDELVAFIICCIPLSLMMSLTYTLAICFAMYSIRLSGTVRLDLRAVCLVLLMMAWELLHCVGASFSIVDFVIDFMPLIALVFFMSMDASRLDYGFVVRCFAVVTACICMVLVCNLLIAADFDARAAVANLQRLGISAGDSATESVVVVNPNTLGIVCVLAGAGLMQLAISGYGKRPDYFVVVILLTFGTMTLSRTFLVCIAFAMVLLLFSAKGGAGERVKLIFALFAIVLLTILLLHLLLPEVLGYFYGRFQEEDLTTGRMDLMAIYHKAIVSDAGLAFFGVGLQDLHLKLIVQNALTYHVPHNGLQELVVVWGVPGLLMFCALLGLMVKQSRRLNGKQSLINYIPLLIILVKIQAGQMITSSYTILALSFAYLSLCYLFAPKQDSGNAEGSV